MSSTRFTWQSAPSQVGRTKHRPKHREDSKHRRETKANSGCTEPLQTTADYCYTQTQQLRLKGALGLRKVVDARGSEACMPWVGQIDCCMGRPEHQVDGMSEGVALAWDNVSSPVTRCRSACSACCTTNPHPPSPAINRTCPCSCCRA